MPKNRFTPSNDGHPVSIIQLSREGENPVRSYSCGERTGLVGLELTQWLPTLTVVYRRIFIPARFTIVAALRGTDHAAPKNSKQTMEG